MPHATLTVLVREGKASQRSRWGGDGSMGPSAGMERKCNEGEVVARHSREWVGETASDQSGGEGMGYVC